MEVIDEEGDGPFLYLSLGNIKPWTNNCSHDHGDYDDGNTRSSIQPSFGGGSDNIDNEKKIIIRGECIICFENFEAGDTIVHNNSSIVSSKKFRLRINRTLLPPCIPQIMHGRLSCEQENIQKGAAKR